MKRIINGIVNENPTFILLLGLCPTLALTHTFESAYLMGLSLLIILFFTSIIISLIKNIIPRTVQIPVYIIVIATLVTSLEMLLKAYIPALHETLGIYLPLVVVNCIILGRSLAVYSKESVGTSMLDAIGIGLGFTLSLSMIAIFREVIGGNTITIMSDISRLTGYKMVYQVFPDNMLFPISILKQPAGAFLMLGILLGIFNMFKKEGA